MKKKLLLFSACFGFLLFKCQVGINTTVPMATLDINGTTKIRDASPIPISEPLDRVMIFDTNSIVRSIDVQRIFKESPRSTSIVKGTGGSGFSVLSLTLLNGWQKANFAVEEIDEGGDFDMTSQEFTAPEDGIYNIYFFIESASVISASTLGAGIFKIDGDTGNRTLLAEESFLNVSVLGINVSPPTRSTQTIVKLNKNDKIAFGVKIPLININLLTNSKANFSILRLK